jgi:hypothetical protein
MLYLLHIVLILFSLDLSLIPESSRFAGLEKLFSLVSESIDLLLSPGFQFHSEFVVHETEEHSLV